MSVPVIATAGLNTPSKALQRELTRTKKSLLSKKQPLLIHVGSRFDRTEEAVLHLCFAKNNDDSNSMLRYNQS